MSEPIHRVNSPSSQNPPPQPEPHTAPPLQPPAIGATSLTALPLELVVDILSRLPVKTLTQLRCVCKLLKTLISDSEFIKTQLKRSSLLSKRLILTSKELHWTLRSCSLGSVFDNQLIHSVHFGSHYDVLKGRKYRYKLIIQSLDGLLCMINKLQNVGIWNPSIRVFSRLPDLGLRRRPGCYYIFGFGYDTVLDDYKVVCMFYYQDMDRGDLRIWGTTRYAVIVKVCRLQDRYWRRIEGFRNGMISCGNVGKYVSGCVCWPFSPNGGIEWKIVAFDLAKEVYVEVAQPNYGENDNRNKVLGVLDGWLCVMCGYEVARADLWVMKEFGVRESWIKLVSVPNFDGIWWLDTVAPLSVSKDGDVLIRNGLQLVVYHPKDGSFTYPVVNNVRRSNKSFVYCESLVSPTVGE